MAETNDVQAHYRSIDTQPNSQPLLNGQRYSLNFQRNQQYQIPQKTWQPIYKDLQSGNMNSLIKIGEWYVNDHYTWQVPRLLTLERYYLGDSNIHYWKSEKENRADNRIAGGLPRYITDFGIGYQFGNDLTFGYSNATDENDDGESLLQEISDYNNGTDEPYHEKNMGKHIWNTGRAYELLYVPEGSNTPKMMFVDPSQCFVVYDTSIEKCPLFAVRYYAVNVMDDVTYQVEVYTDKMIYYFDAGSNPASDWSLTEKTPHYFGDVPINEIDGNEERIGKWEPHLDKIDARDKSLSEMANSQEDFSNATLVLSGDISDTKTEIMHDNQGNNVYVDSITGELTTDDVSLDSDGVEHPNSLKIIDHSDDLKSNMMVLKPSKQFNSDGSVTYTPITAEYLTKQLNGEEWQSYINLLTQDIHKETNTPDMSDDNFVGNATGVAMAYKLMGSDQERVITETLYKRGIMRRLRLLCNYWNTASNKVSTVSFDADDQSNNPANNVTIKFTPNLPKNEQEIITNLMNLHNTGEISSETFLQLASQITGVPADQEQQRLDDEQDKKDTQAAQAAAKGYQMANTMAQNNSSSDDGENTDSDNDDDNSTDDGQMSDDDNS